MKLSIKCYARSCSCEVKQPQARFLIITCGFIRLLLFRTSIGIFLGSIKFDEMRVCWFTIYNTVQSGTIQLSFDHRPRTRNVAHSATSNSNLYPLDVLFSRLLSVISKKAQYLKSFFVFNFLRFQDGGVLMECSVETA